MKTKTLGETLLRASPKLVNELNVTEEAFDFTRLRSTWFPQQRSLVVIYGKNTYGFFKLICQYLLSDHVCTVFPDHITLQARQEIERMYQPNVILDARRSDLGEPKSVFMDVCVYHYSTKEHNLHPKLKLMTSTSGSTGSPKLVKLSHENLLANIRQMEAGIPVEPLDVGVIAAPISFSASLSVFMYLLNGSAKVVPCPGVPFGQLFWEMMRQHKGNLLFGVPLKYEEVAANEFRDLKGVNLRYLTIGGGKPRPELRKAVAEYCKANGVTFFHVYGASEASGRCTLIDVLRNPTKDDSIGKPVIEGKFTIADDGELLYSGPNVFGGYSLALSDLAEFEQPKYLHTGDLARVDDDGFYYVIGRKKRQLKFSGNRVNLDELEPKLSKALDAPVYCTGLDDKYLVLLVSDPSLHEDRINSVLSSFMSPILLRLVRIRRIDKIPENNNNKVDYQKILELESQGKLMAV